MSIDQVTIGAGPVRSPAGLGGPQIEVLLGAAEDAPVGLLHVTIPPGGGMPAHAHGPSTVVLVASEGEATLQDADDADRAYALSPGTVTTVPVGRRVSLENTGDVDAKLVIVVSPPDFARSIAG